MEEEIASHLPPDNVVVVHQDPELRKICDPEEAELNRA
jgi:hypothetical protein